jgi:hypothetical protein
MNLASMVLLLAWAAADGPPARPPASICNEMTIELADVSIDNAGATAAVAPQLHPGECAILPNLPAGAYAIHFTERGKQQSALCVQGVSLRPGASIRIAPDDQARCVF